MTNITDNFPKPSLDGQYRAKQSQVIYGLWTPYGIISPVFTGVWPDGLVTITYNLHRGAKFTKIQKKKIDYAKHHGVEVNITHIDAKGHDD